MKESPNIESDLTPGMDHYMFNIRVYPQIQVTLTIASFLYSKYDKEVKHLHNTK